MPPANRHKDEENDPGFELPGGIAAAVALVVAGLAAVGVSGGMLVRAVRNAPGAMAFLLAFVVLAAFAVPVLSSARKKHLGVALVLGLIGGAAVLAIFLGAASVDDRDQPSVAVTTTTSAAGIVTVKVKATANGLRSQEDMLVQIQGISGAFPQDADAEAAMRPGCLTSRFYRPPAGTPAITYPGDLLSWSQAGAGADGTASVEVSAEVASQKVRGVCVAAIYRSSSGNWVEGAFDAVESVLFRPTGSEGKYSVAYVRIG